MAKAAALKAFTKAVTKKKGRPKVDKRKTKAKRKAQSKARQAQFQQREAAKAEAQGTTKTKLAEKRSIERKAKTIRGKDIDASTKNAAIRLVEDNPKLTADQAIKKAKFESEGRLPKVKSRARSETAKLRAKGAFKGFTEDQMKERKNLIASALREMASEGKTRTIIKSRVLSLNPTGEKLIKQKGGIDKILEKPRRYLYQRTDAPDPPEGVMDRFGGKTKAEKRKNMKEAYNEMSKTEKLDFIRKDIAPDYSKEQLENLMFPPRGGINIIKGKSKTQIEGLRNRLKDKGLLPSLGETRRGRGTKQGQALVKEIRKIKKEAQNIRDKDIPKVQTQIDRAQDALKTAKTTEVKNKLRENISKLKKEKERLTNLANNYEKGKVTKAKKTLSKIQTQQLGMTRLTPTKKAGGKVGMYKSGKQIKSGPRGCGAALRGYGKAMKGKR